MNSQSVVQRLANRLRGASGDPPDGVCPSKIFKRIVERERARADRNAHVFSLVTFTLKDASRRSADACRLVGELGRRIRFTDVIGCINASEIGVLLPETRRNGASKFAADIQHAVAGPDTVPGYSVYTYPEHTDGRGLVDHPSQLWFADLDPAAPSSQGLDGPSSQHRTESQRVHPLDGFDGATLPWWKRFLDILGATLGLVLLSPVFLLMAVLIKILSPGPVLYSQERVGYLGRCFKVWKFRTMHLNADTEIHKNHFSRLMRHDIPMKKLDEEADPRLIPCGKWLRQAGIDELPQLLNILRGEMSFIGPRPCIEYEARDYRLWQRGRMDAIPGLTGLWQVSGKNRTTFNQMMRMDIKYSRKKSPWLDLKILLKTPSAILAELLPNAPKARRGDEEKGAA